MKVTIAVATYRRPQELRRLLDSIIQNEEPSFGWSALKLVVVDNDPNASAFNTYQEAQLLLPMEARYVIEVKPGHASARNRSVYEGLIDGSEFIQFIDDDEIVSPRWLREMEETQQRFAADFVCGAVISEFESEPPGWISTSGAFARRVRMTGTVLAEFNDGNLLARIACLTRLSMKPFPEEMSLLGGADTFMSRTQVGLGAKAVWSQEAYAIEVVSSSRMRPQYVATRRIRVGNTDAYCQIMLTPGGQRVSWRTRRALRAFAASIVRLLLCPYLAIRRGKQEMYRSLFSALFNLGRSSGYVGLMVREYARGDSVFDRMQWIQLSHLRPRS